MNTTDDTSLIRSDAKAMKSRQLYLFGFAILMVAVPLSLPSVYQVCDVVGNQFLRFAVSAIVGASIVVGAVLAAALVELSGRSFSVLMAVCIYAPSLLVVSVIVSQRIGLSAAEHESLYGLFWIFGAGEAVIALRTVLVSREVG